MGAGLTQHSAPLGIRQHRRPTVASLGIARSPRAGGPRPKVKIGGSWGMGAASRAVQSLAALWMVPYITPRAAFKALRL